MSETPDNEIIVDAETSDRLDAIANAQTEDPKELLRIAGGDIDSFREFAQETGDPEALEVLKQLEDDTPSTE